MFGIQESSMKDKQKEEVADEESTETVQSFATPALGGEEMEPEKINTAEEVKTMDDPLFIRDPMSLKPGDHVDIEVTVDNYKGKFFRDGSNNLQRRTCRVAGESRSNYYGLGYFISPLFSQDFKMHNEPFSFFINEYGLTWTAFRVVNENDNSGQ